MRHPFQCILYGRDPTDKASEGFLVVACGPKLISVSLTSNEVISEWPGTEAEEQAPAAVINDVDNGERPTKKQKTSNDAPKLPSKAPNVIKLITTPNNLNVVAVTDDKFVRIFEAPEGRLTEISSRPMPKRPCGIQVLPDNATILVADKFGDVYSLPLIPATIDDVQPEGREKEPPAQTPYKPSASEATVHSQRNRQVLAMQMNQKNFTPRKEVLKFEHQLELGHVSMLTDLKFLTREVEGQQRGYIVTADRDEHIRISRAPPQAHITEGFCLGHKEFVNRVCQIGSSDLLVSGGGDDWLGVWNWQTFKLLKKFDLKSVVKEVTGDTEAKLAVSGIWSFDLRTTDGVDWAIAVACEKVPALFFISRPALEAAPSNGVDGSNIVSTTVSLPAAPLDVTAIGDQLLVTVDARADGAKRLGSMIMSVHDSPELPIRCGSWKPIAEKFDLDLLNEHPKLTTESSEKELDAFLYTVANLRKRRDQEAQDGPEED
ncbi:Putative WD40/YVTN repeat-like-containing domain superfamily [Septoria linicola]|uniref:WD40/YVTN repeat-like-containing domain superfamily n=1 Tax=Septoria linicola TaxID=215465 RepID=A0A9Q9AXL6_9PEZI|nr:Putative WD40/YVTN repeat-like-containing domain superfamily [Septoria linicola]